VRRSVRQRVAHWARESNSRRRRSRVKAKGQQADLVLQTGFAILERGRRWPRGIVPPGPSKTKTSRCLDPVGQDQPLPRRPDPIGEVDLAWQCQQATRLHLPRSTCQGAGQIANKVLDSFHTCPIPEVARLGCTLRAWKAQILAYFDTHGVSDGGTEAINPISENRAGRGFR
jgi:hypothetical protein